MKTSRPVIARPVTGGFFIGSGCRAVRDDSGENLMVVEILVPKLRLGTPLCETLFRTQSDALGAVRETEFRQTGVPKRSLGTRICMPQGSSTEQPSLLSF